MYYLCLLMNISFSPFCLLFVSYCLSPHFATYHRVITNENKFSFENICICEKVFVSLHPILKIK